MAKFTKKQEEEFNNILDALEEANALNCLIVAGSWAEFLYEKTDILLNFESEAKTMDIDFLLNDNKPITTDRITSPICEKGFQYLEDPITGVSKFSKEGFEVEFLIAQRGDGLKPLPRNSLGIQAQQLTHIGFVKDNYTTKEYNGHLVNIPFPEAYVLQKMMINHRRKGKATIDRNKIEHLLPYLDKTRFRLIHDQLSIKEKKYVGDYISAYCPEFGKQVFRENEGLREDNFIKMLVEKQKELEHEVEIPEMEKVWHAYFDDTPMAERNGIPWDGKLVRPAIFEDRYIAECKKQSRKPEAKIYDHFWKNCVERQGYEPKFCVERRGREH